MTVSLEQIPPEEIEGYEDPSVTEKGAYPLHDIMVRSEIRTVSEVVRRIRRGRFFLDPDFQRDFVWKPQNNPSWSKVASCVYRFQLCTSPKPPMDES